MKHVKRILASALAFLLVLALTPAAFAADTTTVTVNKEGLKQINADEPVVSEDGTSATIALKLADPDGTRLPDDLTTKEVSGGDGSPVAAYDKATAQVTITGMKKGNTYSVTLVGEAVKLYTVSYELGDGTGTPPAAQKYAKDDPVTLAKPDGITPPEGKKFSKWTSKEVSLSGETFDMPEQDVTLTAEYTPLQTGLSITFKKGESGDGNVSGIPADVKDLTEGDKYTIPAAAPTADGMVFEKWEDESGTTYDPGQTITIGETNLTLTAKWHKRATDVSVSFGEGDGTDVKGLPSDAENLTEGDSYTIPATAPTQAGKVFIGWKANDGKIYQPGDTITLGQKGLKLTAQWAVPAVVEYKPGMEGVTGMPDPAKVTVGVDAPFTAAKAPTRIGYAFQGWKAGWEEKTYQAGEKITISADAAADADKLTLTAQWAYMTPIPGNPVSPGTVTPSGTRFSIYAEGSSGGTVSPSGWSYVDKGGSLTVSFWPKSGYSIKAVYIDNVKTGTEGGQYTFRDVSADHKIYVEFEKAYYGSDSVPPTGDERPLAQVAVLSVLLTLGLLVLLRKRAR